MADSGTQPWDGSLPARLRIGEVDMRSLFFHSANTSVIAQLPAPHGFQPRTACRKCKPVAESSIALWQRAVSDHVAGRLSLMETGGCAVVGEGGAASLSTDPRVFSYVIRAHPNPGAGLEAYAGRQLHTTVFTLQKFGVTDSSLVHPRELRVLLCGPTRDHLGGVGGCWRPLEASDVAESSELRISPLLFNRIYSVPVLAAKQVASVLCNRTASFGWHHMAEGETDSEYIRRGISGGIQRCLSNTPSLHLREWSCCSAYGLLCCHAAGDWWWSLIRPRPPLGDTGRRKAVSTLLAQRCV
jgi:hypothetical protein